MKNLVVIDDEVYICNIIQEALNEFSDFRINNFNDPVEAAKYIKENGVDLVLTDLVMGDHSGVEILETTLVNQPDAVVILMTGYPTVKTAISVMNKGGYDYLIKPFKLDDLKSTILRGLEHQRLKRENVELKSQVELMKIAEAMAHGMKLQPLLNLIVESAVRELPSVASSIVMFNKKSHRPKMKARNGEDVDPDVTLFLKGSGPRCEKAIETLRPCITNEEVIDNGLTYRRSFVSYPLVSRRILLGLLNLVYDNRFRHISPGQMRLISLLASNAASAIETSNLNRDLKWSYMQTIKALAAAIEARDHYTAGHTDRVFELARLIARRLGWGPRRINQMKNGCLLHDIGKIGVPDSILNKPGRLTDDERAIMQHHPEMGARIIGDVPFLKPTISYILTHHERYDGKGYPGGLSGEDIPIEGRILAVADTFDAMTSDRPYRRGKPAEEAINELIVNKGTQFDPAIVDIFVNEYRRGAVSIIKEENGQKTLRCTYLEATSEMEPAQNI